MGCEIEAAHGIIHGAEMSTGETAGTVEALVSAFRREARAGLAAVPELEVRFERPDAEAWARACAALAGGALGASPAEASRTLTTVVRQPGARGDALLRVIEYDAQGERTADRGVAKAPVVPTVRARAGAIGYGVALSTEEPAPVPSASAAATVRAKARLSFRVDIAAPRAPGAPGAPSAPGAPGESASWRVDATAVRSVGGGDHAAVRSAAAALRSPDLFKRGATGAFVGVSAEFAAAAQFEIEAEYIGAPDAATPAAVAAVAAAVAGLLGGGGGSAAALARIARWVDPGRRGRPPATLRAALPQARALTRGGYRAIYPPLRWLATDKADGTRAVASARGARAEVLSGGALAGTAGAGPGLAGETVVDGEWVGAPITGGTLPAGTFYAFDVIALGGADSTGSPLEERIARLPAAVAALRAAGVPAEAKTYRGLADPAPSALRAALEPLLTATPAYERDGLILAEGGRGYADTRTMKWKPASSLTIDFVARVLRPGGTEWPPGVAAGDPLDDVYALFVGVDAATAAALGAARPAFADVLFPGKAGAAYGPAPFAPSDAPRAFVFRHRAAERGAAARGALDGRVIELRRRAGDAAGTEAPGEVRWEFVRERVDRAADAAAGGYFGNDWRVAEETWANYVDEFPAAMLWDGPGGAYFAAPAAGAHRPLIWAVTSAKARRIRALAAAGRLGQVVDLGAGHGQDLARYADAGVRALFAVDADREALVELVRRRYELAGRRARAARTSDSTGAAATGPAVFALAADLAAETPDAVAQRLAALGCTAGSADAVVSFLAAHYWLRSVASYREFAGFAARLLRPGGALALVSFDGAAVHARLAALPVGGVWAVGAAGGSPPRWALRRAFDDDALMPAGQAVDVLLPFSAGEFRREFLINFDSLARELTAAGFTVESAGRLTPGADSPLDPDDRAYFDLFGEIYAVKK